MDDDPLEGGLDEYMSTHSDEEPVTDVDVIENLESSAEWNMWRDTVAHNMFNEWNSTYKVCPEAGTYALNARIRVWREFTPNLSFTGSIWRKIHLDKLAIDFGRVLRSFNAFPVDRFAFNALSLKSR
ncbi:hypothetical protein ACS0TY_004472 [Phlomoides rotata]